MKSLSKFEKQILFWGLLAHLIAAWFSVGFHHPDEHYQIVEFANYKIGSPLTPVEKLPWEFATRIRPGLQPFMAFVLLKAYHAAGWTDPYNYALILRLISGLAALATAFAFHRAIVPQIKNDYLKKAHLILSVLGWGLVYIHVRFSSENWSAMAMAWALIYLWKEENKWRYLLFGVFAGLSVVFRFQALFMVGAAGLWMLFIDKSKFKSIVAVAGGFLLSIGFGMLFERWLYGAWNFSGWAYVEQNIFHNRAAAYGVSPWYWYFTEIIKEGLAPFSIIMLLSIFIMPIARPKHILSWMMPVFLLGHIVVAHKEFRFLWPLSPFYPFFAVVTVAYLQEKLSAFHNSALYTKAVVWFRRLFWTANTLALLLMITKPANDMVALNKDVFRNVKAPTTIIYSKEFNPYINGDTLGATFYSNPLIHSYRINKVLKDPSLLKGNTVWIFSEYRTPSEDVIFQYSGQLFDSSRAKVIWRRLPEWTYKLNFNGWVDRSNPYTIYELY
jgi:phosphatidylinositol glycan class B